MAEAKQDGFAGVCVNTTWARICKTLLADTKVKVCVVVGFPLGATTPEVKALEATQADVDEIDMVLNIGALKSGDLVLVERDIRTVRNAIPDRILKVILESCLLSREEKMRECHLEKKAEVDYVKTSAGLSTDGATVEDVALMRATVGPDMGVKASAGVKTYEQAVAMKNAGATRIGTSNGPDIVKGALAA